MKIIAGNGLAIYILRRALELDGSKSILEAYRPFYLCNINTIFLSVTILFDRDFFLVTGLLGGLFTFIIPNGIFTDRYLTFPTLDSIFSHYVIVVIPMVLFITRTHKLYMKNIYQVFIGLLITMFNVEVLQGLLFNTHHDYLFFRSTMPYTIPGVPQLFVISTLAIVLVTLIYVLDYFYLSYFQKHNKILAYE